MTFFPVNMVQSAHTTSVESSTPGADSEDLGLRTGRDVVSRLGAGESPLGGAVAGRQEGTGGVASGAGTVDGRSVRAGSPGAVAARLRLAKAVESAAGGGVESAAGGAVESDAEAESDEVEGSGAEGAGEGTCTTQSATVAAGSQNLKLSAQVRSLTFWNLASDLNGIAVQKPMSSGGGCSGKMLRGT